MCPQGVASLIFRNLGPAIRWYNKSSSASVVGWTVITYAPNLWLTARKKPLTNSKMRRLWSLHLHILSPCFLHFNESTDYKRRKRSQRSDSWWPTCNPPGFRTSSHPKISRLCLTPKCRLDKCFIVLSIEIWSINIPWIGLSISGALNQPQYNFKQSSLKCLSNMMSWFASLMLLLLLKMNRTYAYTTKDEAVSIGIIHLISWAFLLHFSRGTIFQISVYLYENVVARRLLKWYECIYLQSKLHLKEG